VRRAYRTPGRGCRAGLLVPGGPAALVRLLGQKYGLWRVAEDDPDSDLYAESSDADSVIGYMSAHA
jgi:hypothetical protein